MRLKIAALLLLLLTPAFGDSLLPEDPNDLYAPNKIRVGDLVTVVIQDDVKTNQLVQVKNSANTGITNPISTLVGAVTGITPSHKDASDRAETATTQSSFSQTVTATVVGIDRDNLSLQATSEVKLDGKKRVIALTGKVRRRDVAADNTVGSQYLADASISVDGVHKSPVQSGLMTRVLRFLF